MGFLPGMVVGWKLPTGAFAMALASIVASGPAVASSVFTSGPFTLPEGITQAPNADYLVSDADNDAIYDVPTVGGSPTSNTSVGFSVFGEIALPSGYAQSGQYLAYGPSSNAIGGSPDAVASLVGVSGLGAPTPVVDVANGWFADAVVAPANFGTIGAGQVVLSNEPGGSGSGETSFVQTLDASGTSVTTFAALPAGVAAFGVGFAPAGFGADAGDLFVSDSNSGNLYVVDAAGQSDLFATLPLPAGYSEPGLRQLAWAPAGFGPYGGDLFVSVAAQNGGGGKDGEIDVLDPTGATVAIYNQGDSLDPLDPRGLFFVNSSTLLVADADPGIQLATPRDFIPAPVPEPGTWAFLLVGSAGLGASLRRRREQAYGAHRPDGLWSSHHPVKWSPSPVRGQQSAVAPSGPQMSP